MSILCNVYNYICAVIKVEVPEKISIKSVYITSIGKTFTSDVMKPLKTALSCGEFILYSYL